MKYSIIVPTYNRLEEIKELIESLDAMSKNADCPAFQLIVIDDGSTDSTVSFLQDYIETKSGIPIEYYSQSNKGPGAARNYGMSVAKGDYFIFVDSDCLIPEDYLAKIDHFIENKKPEAFGGPDTFHPSFSPLLKAINYSMTSFIGTGGTRGKKNGIGKFYPRSFNMGFKKEVFGKIGGFNALRHGQDMDYSARIYEAGYHVQLIPDAFVYHKRRTSLKKFFKQIFNWGIARVNLSRLHQGFLKPVHLAPAILVIGSIIFLSFLGFGVLPKIGSYLLVIPILIGSIAFFQAYKMYRSYAIAGLSIITLFVQVFAYGIGTLSGLFQLFILRNEETKGFTKDYYK